MRHNGPDQRAGRVALGHHTPELRSDDVADAMGRVLRDYQARGLLQEVSTPTTTPAGVAFDIVWNDRPLQVVFDSRRAALAVPDLLTNLGADTPMYAEFTAFVRALRSSKMPPHRRIQPEKAGVSYRSRGGSVAVSVKVRDGDVDYATRQLLRFLHETFAGFLNDPQYSDYEYAEFGISRWI